ncbi:LysE family translocator [Pseudohalioglobus lutimaris]|uniref:LysE family translocator n=1 Tax=Pseudohalioglobus lutimaris TaxID=1737061 RepID=A0A2N5WYK0_9GAMM|nr:LysE family translocator [Pseudohalioglobus lutimaris]PLW67310.1 LysE family translocator [Pseudohalioglobus lutimaris]
MDIAQWLSLFSICLLGAMSPGPSLAVVINAALRGGRSHGLAAALAHGLGVGLYGLLTVVGLAVLVTRSPALFLGLQLAGAAYLVYLGIRSLRSQETLPLHAGEVKFSSRGAAISGFLVAFLNPKLAVFMLALFAQFLNPETGPTEKAIMALTVGFTDAGWYCLMVVLVSNKAFFDSLRRSSQAIDRVFGVILILLAAVVTVRALA